MATIEDISKLYNKMIRAKMQLIKQTMKDNDMGVKDAYEKCKSDYLRRYGYSMPTS
jgi:hypothetical protein